MAQTKAKSKSSKPKSAKSKSSKSASSRSSNRAKSSQAARKPSSNGHANGVAEVAKRGKTPLLAGGAALIGAAGGMAYAATKSGGKRVKIRSKDLRKAAKDVSGFGEQIGDLTNELRTIRNKLSD